jgi:hypothetical protein
MFDTSLEIDFFCVVLLTKAIMAPFGLVDKRGLLLRGLGLEYGTLNVSMISCLAAVTWTLWPLKGRAFGWSLGFYFGSQ